MELRQLRQFIAVAEERHFGRAAERLSTAQPALSQQIRQLEERLGVTLLERTTRRVDLTPAGQLLLDRGRRIVTDVEALAADVRQVGRGSAGALRLGFAGSATYGTMPRLAREVARRLPGATLRLQGEMSTPDMEAALRERTLDAAVLHPPVASPGLERRLVRRERLVLAVPTGCPLATGRPVPASALAGRPLVCHAPDSAVHRALEEMCRAAGFAPLIGQVARESAAVLSLVAAGGGEAVVPEALRALQLHGVAYEELADPPAVDLAVAWRSEDRSPLLRTVLTMLQELEDAE